MMTQKTIHLFEKWRVKEGQLETVLNPLMEVVSRSMEEQGNLYVKVHQSTVHDNTLLVFKGYTDEAALAEHRSSNYFQNLVVERIIPLLEDREVIVSTQLMLGLPGIARKNVVIV